MRSGQGVILRGPDLAVKIGHAPKGKVPNLAVGRVIVPCDIEIVFDIREQLGPDAIPCGLHRLLLGDGDGIGLFGRAVLSRHIDGHRIGAFRPRCSLAVFDSLAANLNLDGRTRRRRSGRDDVGRGSGRCGVACGACAKLRRQAQVAQLQRGQIGVRGRGGRGDRLDLIGQRAEAGNVEVQEGIVVHRETVCIQLDEVNALVLEEAIGIVVFQTSALVHTDGGKVQAANTKHSLTARKGRNGNDGGGVRKHVVSVGPIRRADSRCGHDFLVVVLRIDQQNKVIRVAVLAVRRDCQQGNQVAHGGRLEVRHLDFCLFLVCTAHDGGAVADIADHTNRLIVAVAHDDAVFQTVGQCFRQNRADVAVQPFRAEVELSFTDRDKGRQLIQADVHFLKARGQLFDDLCAQLAPRGLVTAIGVQHHPDRAAGRGKLDLVQQRVLFGQVLHDAGNDGLRENDIDVFKGLFRIATLQGVADLLVVFFFFGGQLAHAACIQGGVVKALLQVVQLGLILSAVDLADGLAHLCKNAGQLVGLVVLDGIAELLPQVRELLVLLVHVLQIHVVVSFLGYDKRRVHCGHAFTVWSKLGKQAHQIVFWGFGWFAGRFRGDRSGLYQHLPDDGISDALCCFLAALALLDAGCKAHLQNLFGVVPRLTVDKVPRGLFLHSGVRKGPQSDLGELIQLIRRFPQVLRIAAPAADDGVKIKRAHVVGDTLRTSQKRVNRRAGYKAVCVSRDLCVFVPDGVVDCKSFRNFAAVAVNMDVDLGQIPGLFQLVGKVIGADVVFDASITCNVTEDVNVSFFAALLDIKIRFRHFLGPPFDLIRSRHFGQLLRPLQCFWSSNGCLPTLRGCSSLQPSRAAR
nr:MAG TPA: hypothetical protein [Caudoviricetes sp.]